ncbi:MAG TPA: glycosyltransferase [Saprospiraceae bacterium]|nr:glycosyltransferase [Saprospiraceae bacterium]
MKIFFPVLNWGLGHASRSLPLIKTYMSAGHEVLCASDGEALSMLRRELPDQMVLQLPGYDILYGSRYMPINMLKHGRGMLKAMKAEHELTKVIVDRHGIECIISDNRYGCYHVDIPSALITHQLQVFTGQKLLDVYIRRQIRSWCKNFSEIWIPDQFPPNNITGDLSGINTEPIPKYYLGVLSELSSAPKAGKYDAIAVISGPEPSRTQFEQLVIKQLSDMNGKYAVVCGKPGEEEKIREEKNITVIPYLSRLELSVLLDQTEIVISRGGYTTLMDLAKTGHKAIICPTPGQYEQIYLADRLANLGQCIYRREENLNLSQALTEVNKIHSIGQNTASRYEDCIERLMHLNGRSLNEQIITTKTG